MRVKGDEDEPARAMVMAALAVRMMTVLMALTMVSVMLTRRSTMSVDGDDDDA